MKVVSIVLIILALMASSALVSERGPRGMRTPEPPQTCDPGSVHSMRDLIRFTRQCRQKNVLGSTEAPITLQPYPPVYLPQPTNTPHPPYPPPPTATPRPPTPTRTPTPEGWNPTPTWTRGRCFPYCAPGLEP